MMVLGQLMPFVIFYFKPFLALTEDFLVEVTYPHVFPSIRSILYSAFEQKICW
jgi:hypothetical protein